MPQEQIAEDLRDKALLDRYGFDRFILDNTNESHRNRPFMDVQMEMMEKFRGLLWVGPEPEYQGRRCVDVLNEITERRKMRGRSDIMAGDSRQQQTTMMTAQRLLSEHERTRNLKVCMCVCVCVCMRVFFVMVCMYVCDYVR